MILLTEGLAMCFLLLMVCVIGIANGPVGLVVLYEEEVQNRVVELGYTTREKLRKSLVVTSLALFVPILILTTWMVYGINGAEGFREGFRQMTVILLIMGLFDRIFIDWYWVGKTKAWIIPGTEDLMPYIPKKVLIRKWLGTVVGFPLMAVLIAWVMTLV